MAFNYALFVKDLGRALQSKDWKIIEEIIVVLKEHIASREDDSSDGKTSVDEDEDEDE